MEMKKEKFREEEITVALADSLMVWIETFFAYLGKTTGTWLSALGASGFVVSLFVDGIIGGVGAVLVFIPNIFLLFLCISLLEDSGYMSRAAYVMDRIMQSFGLHGKSFIPLLIGFGCNVPGVMATRLSFTGWDYCWDWVNIWGVE